jgi:FdrA protein
MTSPPATARGTTADTMHVEVRPGAYADSVTLLQVSKDVAVVSGVKNAQVAMATPLNLDVLASMGFDIPATTPNDMVVALELAEDGDLTVALAAVEAALTRKTRSNGQAELEPPRTTGRRCRTPTPTWPWSRCPVSTRSSRRWTPSTTAAT